ncbi:hypothetical protein [Salmonella sp. s51090]|uniref:hypothetical protein n=1 Tax=Salmonella sp. s51090 TaxID=3159651 RepID=UPI0039818CC9
MIDQFWYREKIRDGKNCNGFMLEGNYGEIFFFYEVADGKRKANNMSRCEAGTMVK